MGSQGVLRLTLVVTAFVATACSKGDDSASIDTITPSTTERVPGPSTPAPCKQNRHIAVFDINGTLSLSDQDAVDWAQDSSNEPDLRPGAPELATAYHQHGYEVMYVTGFPAQTVIADQPVGDAYKGWLD